MVDPNIYLGTDIRNVDFFNVSCTWKMSSDLYVKEDIKNVKIRMKYEKMEFNKKLYDINYLLKNPF